MSACASAIDRRSLMPCSSIQACDESLCLVAVGSKDISVSSQPSCLARLSNRGQILRDGQVAEAVCRRGGDMGVPDECDAVLRKQSRRDPVCGCLLDDHVAAEVRRFVGQKVRFTDKMLA